MQFVVKMGCVLVFSLLSISSVPCLKTLLPFSTIG